MTYEMYLHQREPELYRVSDETGHIIAVNLEKLEAESLVNMSNEISDLRAALVERDELIAALQKQLDEAQEVYSTQRKIIVEKNTKIMELKLNKGIPEMQEVNSKLRKALRGLYSAANYQSNPSQALVIGMQTAAEAME